MSDPVYVSEIMYDTLTGVHMRSDLQENDPSLVGEGSKLHRKAKPVADEMIPSRFYLVQKFDDETGDPTAPPKRLPDFINGGGYFLVSGDAADILREFNLGHGKLVPCEVYQPDRETKIDRGWHVWTLGATKDGLAPDEGGKLREVAPNTAIYNLPPEPHKTIVAVHEEKVKGGADVWIDPALFKAVFFSGPLGRRIVDAGMKSAFYLHKCKMV